MNNYLLAAIVGMLLVNVKAQDVKLPTNEAMAQQRKQISDSMRSTTAQDAPAPTSRTIQAGTKGTSYGASVDAARNLSSGGGFNDVSKATRAQFERLSRGSTPIAIPRTKKGDSDLIVFVSLSMPKEMLVNYAKQAKRFGAVLIMRGFVDDKLSATRQAVDQLNSEGVEWQINPEPFKKFKVTKVPSIVLASAEDEMSVTEDGCATPDAFTMISGDIQIAAALDKIKVLGQPKIATRARQILLADRAAGNQESVTQ